MKRILFTLIILSLIDLMTANAEVQVVQVRRNIPLSEEEPVFKDYYLSGGNKMGLRQNLVVPVMRWVNLRENSQAQDQSMKILEPVGWLKVIYVQEQMSVARLYEVPNSMESPVLDQPGIMMGDVISLERSYIPKTRTKWPRDSAQVPVSAEASPPKSVTLEPAFVKNDKPMVAEAPAESSPPAPPMAPPLEVTAPKTETVEPVAQQKSVQKE
jgi:hypothetical protein